MRLCELDAANKNLIRRHRPRADRPNTNPLTQTTPVCRCPAGARPRRWPSHAFLVACTTYLPPRGGAVGAQDLPTYLKQGAPTLPTTQKTAILANLQLHRRRRCLLARRCGHRWAPGAQDLTTHIGATRDAVHRAVRGPPERARPASSYCTFCALLRIFPHRTAARAGHCACTCSVALS